MHPLTHDPVRRGAAAICSLALLLGGCGEASAAASASAPAEPTATVTGRVTKVSGNDLELALGSYTGGQNSADRMGPGASGSRPADASGEQPSFDGRTESGGPYQGVPNDSASRPSGTRPEGGGGRQRPDSSTEADASAAAGGQAEPAASEPASALEPETPAASSAEPPSGDSPPDGASPPQQGEGGPGSKTGGKSQGRFVENGETLSVRVPVGTPIQYGNLQVDFSQIQLGFVISLTMSEDGQRVLSAEIVSTS